MKYLLLVYGDEQRLDAMSASERDSFENACLANHTLLSERGHLLAMTELQRSNHAMTIQIHKNQVSVTDGTFAERKEQLLGLYLINARDLNEAIQVAAQLPQARNGPVEVRPVQEQGT